MSYSKRRYTFQAQDKTQDIPSAKMFYFTASSLIFALGGAAFWIGLIYSNFEITIAGAIISFVNLATAIVCHLIQKDKQKHSHISHYDCLLQRWYTVVIALVFAIGCACFWIGITFGFKQVTYIGGIVHFVAAFTIYFDNKIYNH